MDEWDAQEWTQTPDDGPQPHDSSLFFMTQSCAVCIVNTNMHTDCKNKMCTINRLRALCSRPWGANAAADRPNTPSTTLLPSPTSPDYFWSSLVPFSHLHFPWPCRLVLVFWQRCMRFFLGNALINEVDSELLALILQRTQGWFSHRRETERLNPR